VKPGGALSEVHVTVLEVVAVLPQASVAVNVLVLDVKHPAETLGPSTKLTVVVLQASVAVALPKAAFRVGLLGFPLLQISSVVPVAVITGTSVSSVHVTVLATDEVLPQKSVAVKVLVCDRKHPLLCTEPSVDDMVGVPHASDAVALPNAEVIAEAPGLQPIFCVE